jgi:hypothetical protein
MLAALPHGMERDGAAWMAEWLALPRIAGACGRALAVAPGLLAARPRPAGDRYATCAARFAEISTLR